MDTFVEVIPYNKFASHVIRFFARWNAIATTLTEY